MTKNDIQLFLNELFTVNSLELRQHVEVSLESEDIISNLSLSLEFRVSVVGVVHQLNISTQLDGMISKSTEGIPILALSSFPLTWRGSLNSIANANVVITDKDLFDGQPPEVILLSSDPSPPSLLQLLDVVQRIVSDSALRFDSFETLPSALSGTSLRSSFLSSSLLPVASQSNVIHGSLASSSTNETGLLLQNDISCQGTECEALSNRTLQSTLQELLYSSLSECNTTALLDRSFTSHLSIDIFLSENTIESRGMRVTTEGVIQCDDHFVGVALVATKDNALHYGWPLQVFLADAKAAISLIRGVPLRSHGFVKGKVPMKSTTGDLLPFDLFSDGRGGVPIPHVALDKTVVANIFLQIRQVTNTAVDMINSEISRIFPTEPPVLDQSIAEYESQTLTPSLSDYFLWFSSQVNGLRMFAGLSGDITLVLAESFGNQGTFTDGKNAVNTSIAHLGQLVQQHYAAAKNYSIPSVDQNLSMQWTGLLSARLSISSLSATPNVTLLSPMSFSALLNTTIAFPSEQNVLFTTANVSYDFVSKKAIVQALFNPSLKSSIPGTKIGMIGDELVEDIDWLNPQLLTNSFKEISANISSITWAVGPLSPLTLDVGKITHDIRFSEIVEKMSQWVQEFPPTISTLTFSSVFTEKIYSLINDPNVTFSTQVIPKDESLDVLIFVRRHEVVSVEDDNTPWKFILDLSRVDLPVTYETSLSFTVTPSSGKVNQFTVKGGAQLTEWSCPFVYQMVSGSVIEGLANITLDFPYLATFNVTVKAATDLAGKADAEIAYDLMDGNPLFSIQLEESSNAVSPFSLLANLQDGLFQSLPTIFGNTLNVSIPPLGSPLGSLHHFEELIEYSTPWLNFPSSFSPQTVLSSEICISSLTSPLQFTVIPNNFPPIPCTCQSCSSAQNIQQLSTLINAQFRECKLDSFVTTSVLDQKDGCGHLAMLPAIPGILWSLNVSMETAAPNVSFEGFWTMKTVPAFSTWRDFTNLLGGIFGTYASPDSTFVDADVAVPPNLRNVFPAKLPAIAVNVTLHHSSSVAVAMASELWSEKKLASLSLTNGSFHGEVDTYFNAFLTTILGVPPLGGEKNVTLLVGFPSDSFNTSQVPTTPYNSFLLQMSGQMRGTEEVKSLSANVKITLPPGKLLSSSLLEDVLPQLPSPWQTFLSLSSVAPRPVIQPDTQIRFDLSYTQLNESLWFIPTGLSIQQSQIPLLRNATNIPYRTLTVAGGVSLGLSAELEMSLEEASGKITILDLISTDISGDCHLSIAVESKSEFQRMSQLLPSRNSFFEQFSATVSLDASATLGNVDLLVSKVDFPLPTVSFQLNEINWSLNNLSDLATLTDGFAWNITFEGGEESIRAFESLLHLNNSVCSWMGAVDDFQQAISHNPHSQKKLPFSQYSFGGLLASTFGNALHDIRTDACEKGEPLGLAAFCAVMKAAFSDDICEGSILNGNALVIDLKRSLFNTSFSDQFQFDTGSFFGSNFPVAVGTTGDLTTFAAFDFEIRLIANFSNGVKLSLDTSATHFSASADFHLSDSIQVQLGPLSLTFSKTSAWLGSPAAYTVSLTDSFGLHTELTGSAGFSSVIGFGPQSQCEISFSIPVLEEFFDGHIPHIEQSGCGKGFTTELEKAFLEHTLFKYFSSSNIFIGQWMGGIDNFLNRLFGPGGILSKAAVPLVDRLITRVIQEEIGQLVGPEATAQIIADISQMTTDIIMNHHLTVNSSVIDQIVLDAFTGILCTRFEKILLPPCPPSPRVGDKEYSWLFHFGTVARRDVSKIGFDLGIHGLADLALNLDAEFVMGWNFTIEMIYNHTHGVSFLFPESPVFAAEMALHVEPTSELSGYIGFLGADIKPRNGNAISQLQGRLVIDNTFHPDFYIDALLAGSLELGFAGPLAQKIAHSPDSLDVLPNWEAGIFCEWKWDLDSHKISHTFNMTDVKFCIGRLLTKVVGTIATKTGEKILNPLQPVLGKDSVLRKPIPGLSDVFGHDLNILQLMIDFCDGCSYEGLLDAVYTFDQIYDDLTILSTIASISADDPSGCNIVQEIRNFTLDFSKPTVTPVFYGGDVKKELQYTGQAANPQNKKIVSSFYTSITTSGKFGVKLYVWDHVAEDLLKALLGQDFPLAGVTIPDATLSAVAQWNIPIWAVPPIELFVSLSGQLTVSFGGVALMFSGVTHAVQVGSPGVIWEGIALPTTHDDGSPRWPLQGAVRLSGGATLNLLFVDASAYLFVQMDASARLVDVDGDGWVTLSEIHWLIELNGVWGSIEKELKLSGGFGIRVRVCIWYIFGKKCHTLVHKEWSKVLWNKDWAPKKFASVASSDGTVNLGMTSFGSSLSQESSTDGRVFNIFSDPSQQYLVVDYTPQGMNQNTGTAHVTRGKLSSSVVTSQGNPGSAPFTWSIGKLTQRVVLPNYPTVTLLFLAEKYPEASFISISPLLVTPDVSPGVQVTSCALLHVTYSTSPLSFSVNGIPCGTVLDSNPFSNIAVESNGDLSGYTGKSLTIGSASLLSVSVPAIRVTVSSASIVGSDGQNSMNILTPSPLLRREVTGDKLQNTFYETKEVPQNSFLKLIGGKGDDQFSFPALQQLNGTTSIFGGGGVNSANFTLRTTEGSPLFLTASPGGLVLNKTLSIHSLFHTNIQERHFVIVGAPHTQTNMFLFAPEAEASVHITAVGAVGSTIFQQVTGCNGMSDVRISLQNGGDHTVVIGSNNVISNFECSVWVTGGTDPSQIDTIIIQASSETRSLRFDFQTNALVVFDTTGNSQWFHLFFEQIERVLVQFGANGTLLEVSSGSPGTEFVFEFPEESHALNLVRVVASNSAILINGTVTQLSIGPEKNPLTSVDPLGAIYYPIAVNGKSKDPLSLILNSGSSGNSPSQNVILTTFALSSMINGTAVPLPHSPSTWFCEQLEHNNFAKEECQAFPFLYASPIHLFLQTGDAPDAFLGMGISQAVVNVSLGSGNDQITWGRRDPSNTLGVDSFDLGVGEDTVSFVLPLGPTSVYLGEDTQTDAMDVWFGEQSPSFQKNQIFPVGPNAEDVLATNQIFFQDFLYLRRGFPGGLRALAIDLSCNDVDINVTTPGTVFRYDMVSNTTYRVIGCAPEAVIVLNGEGSSAPTPSPPPSHWTVSVSLPSLSTPSFVNVWGTLGSEGVVTVQSNQKSPVQVEVEKLVQENFGRVTLGGLVLQAVKIDHLAVQSVSPMTLRVNGTPSDSDLVVLAPSSSQALLHDIRNHVLLANLSSQISKEVLSQNLTIISMGENTIVSLDLQEKEQIYFDGQCVYTNTSNGSDASLSSWFKGYLANVGFSSDSIQRFSSECLVGFYELQQLEVSAPHVIANDMQHNRIQSFLFSLPSTLLQVNGLTSLWGDLTLSNGHLVVEETLNISVAANSRVEFNCQLFDPLNSTVLNLECQESRDGIEWIFGEDKEEDKIKMEISWNSPNCKGKLRNSATESHGIPEIEAVGSGNVDWMVLLGGASNEIIREISFSSKGVALDEVYSLSDSESIGSIQWDGMNGKIQVEVSNGENLIVVTSASETVPMVSIQDRASANVSVHAKDWIWLFANDVTVDTAHSAFLPRESENLDGFCWNPSQCSSSLWTGIALRNSLQFECATFGTFDISDNSCQSQVALELKTAKPILCLPSFFPSQNTSALVPGFPPVIRVSASQSDWPAAEANHVVAFSAIILFFVSVFLSVILWTYTGHLFPFSWVQIVLSSNLAKVNSTGTVNLLSLIEGLEWVISSLFIPCEPLSYQVIVFGIALFLGVLGSVTLSIHCCVAGKGYSTRKWEILSRVAAALGIFLLSPFLFAQLASVRTDASIAVGILATLFFVFLSLVFGFNTFQPQVDQKSEQDRFWISVVPPTLTLAVVFLVSVLGRQDVSVSPTVFLVFVTILILLAAFCELVSQYRILLYVEEEVPKKKTAFLSFVTIVSTLNGLVFVLWYFFSPANTPIALWYIWIVLSPLINGSLLIFLQGKAWRLNKKQKKDQRKMKGQEEQINLLQEPDASLDYEDS